MEYELVAAVDLGSNSFRLQIGRVIDDQVYPLDGLKETVRLASGLQADKCLDEASRQRALIALSRFGERLRGLAPEAVRAVATNTLRVAKNAQPFLREAQAALGFPIEIIAGREEARLIYLGASHSLPPASHRRLVADIGGGSTEFIIGRRYDPLLMESLYMGCVSYSLRFFPDGQVDKRSFREAEIAASRELENIAQSYRALGWKEAIGSSGTARAIADLLEENDLNPDGELGITAVGLERLKVLLIRAGSAQALGLSGMRGDRMPVLPGGLAIMSAIFASFQLERMMYAEGALRLGVLYDLIGRFHQHDRRDDTVAEFVRRYQIDRRQAERVQQLASAFLEQIDPEPSVEHEHDAHFLAWAARLHEIGISIAHSGYHKHGAYVLTFADMPGFSKQDQSRLALLVLAHRGKLDKVTSMPPGDPNWPLVFCLRLAVLFSRSRTDCGCPSLSVTRTAKGFAVDLPAAWLRANPMTAAALEDEAQGWLRTGFELRVRPRAERGVG